MIGNGSQNGWAQDELLAELIRRRMEDGSYRHIEQVEVVARALLETVAFWALHRHYDPSPQQVDDAQARRAVIDLLAWGVLQEGR